MKIHCLRGEGSLQYFKLLNTVFNKTSKLKLKLQKTILQKVHETLKSPEVNIFLEQFENTGKDATVAKKNI